MTMAITYTADHIHLRSADPVAAARFYVEALGAREASRVDVNGALRIILDLGSFRLFLEQVPDSTAWAPEPPFIGIEHIGLGVNDLDAAAADLRGRGVRFTTEPRQARPGVRIAFFEGPDRVRIELIERSGA